MTQRCRVIISCLWRALIAQTLLFAVKVVSVYASASKRHTKTDVFKDKLSPAWWKLQTSGSTSQEVKLKQIFVNLRRHSQQKPCLRLAWSRDPYWRRFWKLWRIWSQKPAGMSARPASRCRAWTRLTSLWSSSPSAATASTRTAATETSPWESTSAGGRAHSFVFVSYCKPKISDSFIWAFRFFVEWSSHGWVARLTDVRVA